MIKQQHPHFKLDPAIGQSTLKAVAGMLRRSTAKKLSDKQLKQRIAASLYDEDQASKAKEGRRTKSL